MTTDSVLGDASASVATRVLFDDGEPSYIDPRTGEGRCSTVPRTRHRYERSLGRRLRMITFEPSSSVPTERQIDGAEALLDVRFPTAYREVIARFDGAYGGAEYPLPGTQHGESIGLLLSLLPWKPESLWSVLRGWEAQEWPRQLIPIGEDGGGNYICLDYRGGGDPAVVFLDHELQGADGITPIATSFGEFLAILHDGDDE